jgi:hypothetical protein
MEEKEQVNLLSLGAKARSKYELYQLLANEGDYYLSPYKECPTKFISEILKENKKVSLVWSIFCFHLLGSQKF